MEKDTERRTEVMEKTLKVLKLIPKTLETHRDFLHNRIKEVVTTNFNDSRVVKHQIEAAERNTDRRLDAMKNELRELTDNMAKGFASTDRRMDFLMSAKKGEDRFKTDVKRKKGQRKNLSRWNKASFIDAFFYFCRDRVKSKGVLKLMQSTLHKRNSSSKADKGIINPYMSGEEFAKGFKAGAWGAWPDEIAFEAWKFLNDDIFPE
ncbi:hypothetical protein Dimus_029272, partial [Dionaea muscipula]